MKRVVLIATSAWVLCPVLASAQSGSAPIVIDAPVPPETPGPAAPGASPGPAPAPSAPGGAPTQAPPSSAAAATPAVPPDGASPPGTATSVSGATGAAGAAIQSQPLVITAPPQPVYAPPPGYVPYVPGRPVYPYPQYAYPQYPAGYQYTPPAQPQDTPERIAASWRRRLAVGATFGVGSPLGVLGAFFEYNFSSLFGATLGAGVGGWFGPAIGMGAYVRPTTWGRWAPYLGAGYSFNFTPGDYTSTPFMTAPGLSHWFNAELGIEYRSFRGVLFRAGLGNALLLNTGDFTNQDYGGRYGPPSNHSFGYDPVSAADAHDDGHVLNFGYVHVDLGYGFD